MELTIVKCDICGSEINVKSHFVPMYRKFDATEGRVFYDEPHIVFETIDICEECLKKCTNIYDKRVQGFGQISINTNPLIE